MFAQLTRAWQNNGVLGSCGRNFPPGFYRLLRNPKKTAQPLKPLLPIPGKYTLVGAEAEGIA
jgi:hypothetical protein